jgi:hypothetical protein
MNLNIDNLDAVRSMPNPSNDDSLRPTEVRDVIDAIRFAYTLTKQLPLPPLVAAFVVALTLGTIPAATTIFCSLIREMVHRCRDVGRPRYKDTGNTDQASTPFDAEERHAAPLFADEPITTNPFESRLGSMEPL